jgi:hypothetical protein
MSAQSSCQLSGERSKLWRQCVARPARRRDIVKTRDLGLPGRRSAFVAGPSSFQPHSRSSSIAGDELNPGNFLRLLPGMDGSARHRGAIFQNQRSLTTQDRRHRRDICPVIAKILQNATANVDFLSKTVT